MRVATIQNKKVLDILNKEGKYTVGVSVPCSNILVRPYKFLMNHYNYKNRPIFSAPIGYNVNFSGAHIEDSVMVILEIPDRFCKMQDYYGWSDFIYFTETPSEYEPFKGRLTVEDFGEYILDMFKGRPLTPSEKQKLVFQVTTQFLRRAWVLEIRDVKSDFADGEMRLTEEIIEMNSKLLWKKQPEQEESIKEKKKKQRRNRG